MKLQEKMTQTVKAHQDNIINEAYEYIKNVTIKQERLLDFKDLYAGYKATVNQFNMQGFKIVYDSYKETLIDKGIIKREGGE